MPLEANTLIHDTNSINTTSHNGNIQYWKEEALKLKEYDLTFSNVSYYSPIVQKNIPPLWRHPIVSNVNCSRLLNGDKMYIENEYKNLKKLKYLQNTFSTSCEYIKKRGYYPDQPLSEEESNFPIAYIRTIYTDYLTIEYQFLLTYAPQNHYCFVVDKKQKGDFHSKIFALSNCFPNIHLITNRYDMDSNGFNINLANYDCMKYLSKKNFKYLIILNNDDMPLKTNKELVEILKTFNGTIDAEYIQDPSYYSETRVNLKLNWTLGHLELFKKGDQRNLNKKILSSSLSFQKGMVQISYPKETIEYLVNELNLTKYLNQLNDMKLFASDELSFQTLIANKYLNIPGRVDIECIQKDNLFQKSYMTRYTKWNINKTCDDDIVRHYICLQNVKTLQKLKNMPHFFINKFKSETDIGGLTCWAEYLYNRTYFQPYVPIKKTFYENLATVQYKNLSPQIKDKEKLCNMSKRMNSSYNIEY
uniref:Glycosyltransferase family 92 protein n=1 Tax=Strongyloides stercoralis TaxID=6248 RepID=A0AAF5CSF1_STRER